MEVFMARHCAGGPDPAGAECTSDNPAPRFECPP
jgi:hypothetical protein